MIDKLVISLPFKQSYRGFPLVSGIGETPLERFAKDAQVSLSKADRYPEAGILDLKSVARLCGIPLSGGISQKGKELTVDLLKHPFESLASSYGSLAFKIYDRGLNTWPCVHIKASPAKVYQGHNVYGFEDFNVAAGLLLALFFKTYPRIQHLLDIDYAELIEYDCAYSVRFSSNLEAKQVVQFMANLSYGQTKSREGFATTAYFGKRNSPHRKLKAYVKSEEMSHNVAELKRKNHNGINDKSIAAIRDQAEYSKGLVRLESTVKKRWMLARGIPVRLKSFLKYARIEQEAGRNLAQWSFLQAWQPIFKTFEGQTMAIFKDSEIEQKLLDRFTVISEKTGKKSTSAAMAAFRTYRTIKSEGWLEATRTISSSTLSRHCKMLADVEISRAHLQNLKTGGAVIIPLFKVTEVNFLDQKPVDYIEPNFADIQALLSA